MQYAENVIALENFRQQWQLEINVTPKHKSLSECKKQSVEEIVQIYDDIETKVNRYFHKSISFFLGFFQC